MCLLNHYGQNKSQQVLQSPKAKQPYTWWIQAVEGSVSGVRTIVTASTPASPSCPSHRGYDQGTAVTS